MAIIITVGAGLVLGFVWSICRVAAEADKAMGAMEWELGDD